MSPPGPVGSIDHVLDAGAHGLQYFERNLPVLEMLGHAIDWTYMELCARYDQQRGLDLATLQADADALDRMVVEAGHHLDESERVASALEQSWTGDGGVAAVGDARQDASRAAHRVASMEQVAEAIHGAVDVIVECVRDKAEACGRIDDAQIDGIPASAVAAIAKFGTAAIGVGPTIGTVANLDVPILARWLPPVAEYVDGRGQLDDAALRRVQELCREWLRSAFATAVTETCAAFVDLCGSTDTAVRDALTVVAQAAEAVDASAFPVGEDAEPLSVRPVPVRPASVGQESVCESNESVRQQEPRSLGSTSTAPLGYVPSGSVGSQMPADPALRSLSRTEVPSLAEFTAVVEAAVATVADDIGKQVRAALDDFREQYAHLAPLQNSAPSQVPTTSQDPTTSQNPARPDGNARTGDDHAVEESESRLDTADSPPPQRDSSPAQLSPPQLATPPNAPALPGPTGDGTERGHLEARLDGYHARVALAHDGTLSLSVGAPDGGSRRFELRVGPFGLPVVVETFEDDVAPAAIPPEAPGPAPQPALPHQPPLPVVDEAPAVPGPAPELSAPPPAPTTVEEPAAAQCPPAPAEPPAPDSASGARLVEAGPL